MTRLYVSRLERDMRMDIERSRYSEKELEGMRCILQRTVDARGKAARIAAAVLVVFDAFYVWAEFILRQCQSCDGRVRVLHDRVGGS